LRQVVGTHLRRGGPRQLGREPAAAADRPPVDPALASGADPDEPGRRPPVRLGEGGLAPAGAGAGRWPAVRPGRAGPRTATTASERGTATARGGRVGPRAARGAEQVGIGAIPSVWGGGPSRAGAGEFVAGPVSRRTGDVVGTRGSRAGPGGAGGGSIGPTWA